MAYIWTKTPADKSLYVLSMSSDGTIITAGEYSTGFLYLSSDSGLTWTVIRSDGIPNQTEWATSMSSDGSVIVANIYGQLGRIYLSTNLGGDWTEVRPVGNVDIKWKYPTISADGSTIIVYGSTGYYTRLYRSTNLGVTWYEIMPAGNVAKNWSIVSISPNGSIIIVGVSYGGVYRSINSGATWTQIFPGGENNLQWVDIAMSDNGSKVIIGVYKGNLYLSTNSCVTWSTVPPPDVIVDGLNAWPVWTLSMNSNGSVIIAGAGSYVPSIHGRLYLSTDLCKTWNEIVPPFPPIILTSFRLVSNGSKILLSKFMPGPMYSVIQEVIEPIQVALPFVSRGIRRSLIVYDWKTKKRLAYLQNAYNIGFVQQTNSVWSGTFTLPYMDEKKEYCRPFNLVEIWDVNEAGEDKYVGLFRIMPQVEQLKKDAHDIVYTLEHVLSTLLDSSLVGYQVFGGPGYENTKQVLENILSHQNEERWAVIECDYTNNFVYEFEDQNLLSALLSVPKPLTDDYYWSFSTPLNSTWGLNLKKVSNEPIADIRYKKNITGITKRTDPRSICTRLYLYGKILEDGTKLSIKNLNNGLEYLDSEDGIENYGIITSIINDERFENEQSLYDYGAALLEKLSRPFITYELDIQTIYNAANLKIGDVVRVVTDDGLDQNLVVQEISKDDLTGAPNDGKIILGHGTVDIGVITKSFI